LVSFVAIFTDRGHLGGEYHLGLGLNPLMAVSQEMTHYLAIMTLYIYLVDLSTSGLSLTGHAGDCGTLDLLDVDDDLYLSSHVDRIFDESWPGLQYFGPDFLSQSSDENGVHHKQLHSDYTSQSYFIGGISG